jgi:hypothetical protein
VTFLTRPSGQTTNKNPGVMLPGLSFDALSTIRWLAGLPKSIYHIDKHVVNRITQAQKRIRLRCSGARRTDSPQRCATGMPPECSPSEIVVET